MCIRDRSSEAAFTSSMQAWRPDRSGVNMAVLDVGGLIVEIPAAFAADFLAVFFVSILLEWLVLGWCLGVVFLADELGKGLAKTGEVFDNAVFWN